MTFGFADSVHSQCTEHPAGGVTEVGELVEIIGADVLEILGR